MNWVPNQVQPSNGMDRLTFLQSKFQECQSDYDEIGITIDNAKRFIGESTGYSSEAEHQKVRLESIGLFEQLDFNPGKCPLCSGTLEHPLPSVEMIKASIANLDKSISNVTREQPKLRSFISGLEQEREKKLEEIKGLQSEIDGIYQQEDERTHLRDINARRGKVIGRISLWIESVENDTESDKQEQIIKSIEAEQLKAEVPEFRVGDTVKVYGKIKEGNRERIQVFEGVVIKRQGGSNRETFTVRKISNGIGVEKTWPLHSPIVEKVEVVRRGKARRAKLFYLRQRTGKAAKVKELVR